MTLIRVRKNGNYIYSRAWVVGGAAPATRQPATPSGHRDHRGHRDRVEPDVGTGIIGPPPARIGQDLGSAPALGNRLVLGRTQSRQWRGRIEATAGAAAAPAPRDGSQL